MMHHSIVWYILHSINPLNPSSLLLPLHLHLLTPPIPKPPPHPPQLPQHPPKPHQHHHRSPHLHLPIIPRTQHRHLHLLIPLLPPLPSKMIKQRIPLKQPLIPQPHPIKRINPQPTLLIRPTRPKHHRCWERSRSIPRLRRQQVPKMQRDLRGPTLRGRRRRG